MNLIAHSIASKGGVDFLRRVGTIATRFGVTPDQAERSLGAYLRVLRDYDCNGTFPITATVLERNPRVVRRLMDAGVELAVHGYVHTDHTTLSAARQREEIAEALRIFSREGVLATGFRGPYLRYNDHTLAAAESLGFRYVSNETVSYDVIDPGSTSPARWAAYQKALRLYSALPSTRTVARPRLRGSLVEIPVAMPDDEILVDRLGFRDGASIGRLWAGLVQLSNARGDLLTLQLHPERGRICAEALAIALGAARATADPVWIAQLRDIAEWWQRRARSRLRVEAAGDHHWQVSADGPDGVAVLARSVACPGARRWSETYLALPDTSGVVECPDPPVIQVSRESVGLRAFLEEEGYAVAEASETDDRAIYFHRPGPLGLADQAEILAEIEAAASPLVRLARWPGGARSALSITGDIDALTLGDFVRRAWEVR